MSESLANKLPELVSTSFVHSIIIIVIVLRHLHGPVNCELMVGIQKNKVAHQNIIQNHSKGKGHKIPTVVAAWLYTGWWIYIIYNIYIYIIYRLFRPGLVTVRFRAGSNGIEVL